MSNKSLSPVDAWGRLRAEGLSDVSGYVITGIAGVKTAWGKMRYALGLNETPRILIPSAPNIRLEELIELKSLEIRCHPLGAGAESSWYIDVTCKNKSLEAVFAELVLHIIALMQEDGLSPDRAVKKAIEDYGSLIMREPSAKPDSNKIRGLFGELWLLQKLLELNDDAIELWHGFKSDPHDFRGGGVAIEVKTSSREFDPVKISSLEQMIPPKDGKLFLYHLVLQEDREGDCIESLCSKMIDETNIDKTTLQTCLEKLGCDDISSPDWNFEKYRPQVARLYGVVGNFPRLDKSLMKGEKFPVGLSKIQYQIDLSYARKYEVASVHDELMNMVKTL